jgi:hypothetical protein
MHEQEMAPSSSFTERGEPNTLKVSQSTLKQAPAAINGRRR